MILWLYLASKPVLFGTLFTVMVTSSYLFAPIRVVRFLQCPMCLGFWVTVVLHPALVPFPFYSSDWLVSIISTLAAGCAGSFLSAALHRVTIWWDL